MFQPSPYNLQFLISVLLHVSLGYPTCQIHSTIPRAHKSFVNHLYFSFKFTSLWTMFDLIPNRHFGSLSSNMWDSCIDFIWPLHITLITFLVPSQVLHVPYHIPFLVTAYQVSSCQPYIRSVRGINFR